MENAPRRRSPTQLGAKPLEYRGSVPVWGINERGQPICHAKRNGKGRDGSPAQGFCQEFKDLGPNGRCKVHNGYAVSGKAHPNYTHGRTSRYAGAFDAREWEIFSERVKSDSLLSLREDIAYTDMVIQRLVERFKSLPRNTILRLQRTNKDLLDTLGLYDRETVEDLAVLIERQNSLLETALQEADLQRDIEAKQRLRLALVDTEQKKLLAGMKSISAERFLSFTVSIVELLTSTVTSRADRSNFITGLSRMVGLQLPEKTEEVIDVEYTEDEEEDETED